MEYHINLNLFKKNRFIFIPLFAMITKEFIIVFSKFIPFWPSIVRAVILDISKLKDFGLNKYPIPKRIIKLNIIRQINLVEEKNTFFLFINM